MQLHLVMETQSASAIDMARGWVAGQKGVVAIAALDRLDRARTGVASPDPTLRGWIAYGSLAEACHFTDWLRHGHIGAVLDTNGVRTICAALADEIDYLVGWKHAGETAASEAAVELDAPPTWLGGDTPG